MNASEFTTSIQTRLYSDGVDVVTTLPDVDVEILSVEWSHAAFLPVDHDGGSGDE